MLRNKSPPKPCQTAVVTHLTLRERITASTIKEVIQHTHTRGREFGALGRLGYQRRPPFNRCDRPFLVVCFRKRARCPLVRALKVLPLTASSTSNSRLRDLPSCGPVLNLAAAAFVFGDLLQTLSRERRVGGVGTHPGRNSKGLGHRIQKGAGTGTVRERTLVFFFLHVPHWK